MESEQLGLKQAPVCEAGNPSSSLTSCTAMLAPEGLFFFFFLEILNNINEIDKVSIHTLKRDYFFAFLKELTPGNILLGYYR